MTYFRTAHEAAFYRVIGERLRRRRNARGLSLTAVAKLTGLRHQRLSIYELGRVRVPAYELARVAQVVGMRPLELFADYFADVAPFKLD